MYNKIYQLLTLYDIQTLTLKKLVPISNLWKQYDCVFHVTNLCNQIYEFLICCVMSKLCSIIACVFYSIKTTIFSYSGKNLTAHLRNEFMKSCLPIMFTSCWQITNRFSSKYPRVFFFYQNNQIVHMVPIYMIIFSPKCQRFIYYRFLKYYKHQVFDGCFHYSTQRQTSTYLCLANTWLFQRLDYFKGKKVDKLYLSYIFDDLKLKRNNSGSYIWCFTVKVNSEITISVRREMNIFCKGAIKLEIYLTYFRWRLSSFC